MIKTKIHFWLFASLWTVQISDKDKSAQQHSVLMFSFKYKSKILTLLLHLSSSWHSCGSHIHPNTLTGQAQPPWHQHIPLNLVPYYGTVPCHTTKTRGWHQMIKREIKRGQPGLQNPQISNHFNSGLTLQTHMTQRICREHPDVRHQRFTPKWSCIHFSSMMGHPWTGSPMVVQLDLDLEILMPGLC